MVGGLLLVLFGVLLGVGATRLVSRRRHNSSQLESSVTALGEEEQSSITALGEELGALTFDPAGPEATPQTLSDYRLALDAYDRAASATKKTTALAALRDGRAALIRLDARRAGRPVPIDALPALQPGEHGPDSRIDPETATGERFLTTGKGGGGTVEVLIDRPEPGRFAIAELAAAGNGTFRVTPIIRTEDETKTLFRLESAFGDYRGGRYLLPPKATHLRIETRSDRGRWSVRITPISAALPLGSEWRGTGSDVLSYQGGPALLTVQIKTRHNWKVKFVCGNCFEQNGCSCGEPDWPAGTPGRNHSLHGREDGRQTLRLPRPGHLILEDEVHGLPGGDWYLSVQPVPVPPGTGRSRGNWRRLLESSITALGEELGALTFDPAGPEATPQTLSDYRLALDAYDRAASATKKTTALAALRDGRAALIRLDARRAGRPVPIDALPALQPGEHGPDSRIDPETATGERFLTTGKGGGGTVEVLIDRPEPGRFAIAELAAAGNGTFKVTPIIRTEDEIKTLHSLVEAWGKYRGGRYLLPPEGTHLRIKNQGRWSVRITPISAASPLSPEWHGTGDDVLSYQGGPALLTVQIKTEFFWQVKFVCGCLKDRFECSCRKPDWPAGTPGKDHSISGTEDGRQTLRLPRPGYLVLDGRRDGTWYLSVQPVPDLAGTDRRDGRNAPMDRHGRPVYQVLPEPAPEVVILAEQGRKIEAIKRYRQLNPGIGLKQAVGVIDGLQPGPGHGPPASLGRATDSWVRLPSSERCAGVPVKL